MKQKIIGTPIEKSDAGEVKIGKVIIDSNCFVIVCILILLNVTIDDNVIVIKHITSNSVAVANPCRVIKRYDKYMEENRLLINEKIRSIMLAESEK